MVGRPGEVVSPDGTKIAFTVTGRGDTMMLVHGAGADSRQWVRLVPHLASRFTVVTIDRRGRRGSGPQGPGHSLYDDARDIAAVAATMPAPRYLVGHSSGARCCLLAAADIADLAGLVLFEPPESADVPDELLDRIERLAADKDPEGVLRAFFVEAVGMAEADFAALRNRPIWPVMMDNAPTMPAELRAARAFDLEREHLSCLEMPTLLLVGGESGPELRQVVDDLALNLPRSTVVTLAGQGHGAMCSAPAQFAAVLREFVDAVGSGGFRPRPGGGVAY